MMSGQGEILDTKPKVEQGLSWKKLLIGFLFVLGASCSFTLSNVLQKIICPTLDFWTLMIIRSLSQMSIMSVYLAVKRIHWTNDNESLWMILLQGFLGGLLILGVFVTIKNVPLGNATAIFFCTPVATFALATCTLRERFGLYRGLISVVMISGVILITRPPLIFPQEDSPQILAANGTLGELEDSAANAMPWIGYCAAICVMLLQAILSILMRQCKSVPLPVIMFWFGVGIFSVAIGGIGIGLVITATKEGDFQVDDIFDLSLVEVACAFAIAGLGMTGYVLFIFAIRWIGPSKTNVFRSFEVIANYLLQLFAENMAFHISDIGGVFLLVLAVFGIGFEQEVMRRNFHRFL